MSGSYYFWIIFSYYRGGDLETTLTLLLYNFAYLTDSVFTYASNLCNSSIYQSISKK